MQTLLDTLIHNGSSHELAAQKIPRSSPTFNTHAERLVR